MSSILGNIHSIETCGTVDGPGIRFVVFMQGCPMRCLYCHNPDTWNIGIINKQFTAENIISQYNDVKEFCKGGITITGGEPLVQIDFVTELFKQAKVNNIHTSLDTSGVLYNSNNSSKIEELMLYTDLVLLDIKHIDDDEHRKLTGHTNKNILEFARYLSDINKPMWIRHVVVPGLNDKEEYLDLLGKFIGCLKNVKALDILPYHNLAETKYDSLGIKYPLKGTKPLTKEEALKARNIVINSIKKARL